MNDMTREEYNKVKEQIASIEELLHVYSGKTIDNIHTQLKARIKEADKEMKAV